jgi:L-ascorbate metabolism protein UlaG (beta-lactamase superfamily)
MYLGGDSGYGKHYKQIGNQFGPFDFAILENGQYNKAWPYIHEMPHQVLEAAKDLQAKRILPVHSSKFALSTHPWDEPLEKITHLNQTLNIQLATPIIGEIVYLDQPNQAFKRWWRY